MSRQAGLSAFVSNKRMVTGSGTTLLRFSQAQAIQTNSEKCLDSANRLCQNRETRRWDRFSEWGAGFLTEEARMARVATIGTGVRTQQLTAEVALRIAWISWLTMLAVPFVLFIVAVWLTQVMGDGIARPLAAESRTWFYVAVVYLVTAVPVSFFFRSHVFKA